MPVKLIMFAFAWTATSAFSQNSVLEKRVTLVYENQKTDVVLRLLERESGARFAYNAEMFGDSLKSGIFEAQTLQVILENLLGQSFAYRVKGNYIIIKSTKEIAVKNEKFIYTISGYISDRHTGEMIPFASVFDSATLQSTLSNEQGFYQLSVEQKPEQAFKVGVSKENYRDTYILIKPVENRNMTVALNKLENPAEIPADTGKANLDKNAFLKAITNAKQRVQSANLKQNFNNNWQVSLLPFIGTNGNMSGTITNRYSFNILGGYAGGVKGLELGGIFNIDRDTSSGVQIAGVYNLTAGPFSGFQSSGVMNNHFSNFQGIQNAGVTNTCSGDFQGIQLAGVVNFARRNMTGIQAAGVMNYSENFKGMQISGLINTTGRASGSQIAGLVNTARVVDGIQIGFINVTDTVRGMQLGFLSFSKTGVHQVEYAYNDVLQHNATFRTGSKTLYNILTAGYHPYANEAFAAGYGLGSKVSLGKKSSLNFELTGTAFYLGLWDDIHSLYRFSLHHETVLFKSISLVIGPDFNFYYNNGLGAPLTGYKNPISYINPLYTHSFNNNRSGLFWVGFHVGIGLN